MARTVRANGTDNVDRLYARAAAKSAAHAAAVVAASPINTPSSTDIVSSAAPVDEPYSFQRHIQVHPDYEKHPLPLHVSSIISESQAQSQPQSTTTSSLHATTTTTNTTTTIQAPPSRPSPLTSLLSSLPISPNEITFQPQEESLPLPFALLPLELVEPILHHLDVATIERFAQTCWRARIITARSTVWKRIVKGIYKPPAMIPDVDGWRVGELNAKHGEEWRTTFVEEERVRMDGCYISVCHYM